MATTAKLVADLGVLLRGMRSHEGVVASHLSQAASDDVATHLRKVDAREKVVADRLARVLSDLGAPTMRLRPSWAPSPTSLVTAVAVQAQPFGEGLVLEATALFMLSARARVARSIAEATGRRTAVDVTNQVVDLYDEYAAWLVATASVLVVDEDGAELVPTATQRLAGRVKDAAGVPARVYGQAAGRVRDLVGLGGEKLAAVEDSVEDALTPVTESDLPVARYDSRSAADAAKAVRALDDLDAVSTVLAYEAQNKDRKTVLDAGDRRVTELSDARG